MFLIKLVFKYCYSINYLHQIEESIYTPIFRPRTRTPSNTTKTHAASTKLYSIMAPKTLLNAAQNSSTTTLTECQWHLIIYINKALTQCQWHLIYE